MALLEEIDEDTVGIKPNYDDRLQELAVRARTSSPNLLVNGWTDATTLGRRGVMSRQAVAMTG